MKYFNICSKRTISTPEGDKKEYYKIGHIKTPALNSNGLWYMRLNQHPDTDYYVFPSSGEELPVIE